VRAWRLTISRHVDQTGGRSGISATGDNGSGLAHREFVNYGSVQTWAASLAVQSQICSCVPEPP
jgi:hypothetical protein